MSEDGGAGREAPRSLFRELSRRNVLRVAGLYLVAAWLLLQVADVLIPLFDLPGWSGRLLFLVLALGFPLAVIFSWVYELTPEGLKREHEVSAHESITHETGRRINLLIGVMAALAVVFVIVDRLLPEAPRAGSSALPAEDGGHRRGAARSFEQDPVAQSDQPHVVVPVQGSEPGLARHRGEARRGAHPRGQRAQGGRPGAITAQLIQARDGSHLWSETYDRTLEDIFAVQEDIAGAVVGELRVQLLGDELPAPATRTENTEAHNLYLRGRYFVDSRSAERIEQALAYFEQAIELAPDYAPAWAGLAKAWIVKSSFGSREDRDEAIPRAKAAVERALELDPRFAEAWASLGRIHLVYDWDWAAAESATGRAMELGPGNANVLREMGVVASAIGRVDEAVELTARSVARDPVRPDTHHNLGLFLYNAGRLSEAEAAFREVLGLRPEYAAGPTWLGIVLLAQGRSDDAIAAVESETDEFWKLFGRSIAYHAVGRTEEADTALADMIDQHAEDGSYQIAAIHAFRGEVDAAFTRLEHAYANRDGGLTEMKADPILEPLKSDPRYTALLEKLDLAD